MENKNLPTIAELFEDNLQLAYKNEQLNLLLNNEPPTKWIKTHPYIRDYKYIPIDKIEYLLRKIFKQYRIEILREGQSFNGVYVVVRLHYLNPVTGLMEWHDGIGACQLQTAKGTSPADLVNINNGALSMAFPIAKTVAIKDAADHFGKLFGCDLNRKDTIPFDMDKSITSKTKQKETERIKLLIDDCKTKAELMKLFDSLGKLSDEMQEYYSEKFNNLK